MDNAQNKIIKFSLFTVIGLIAYFFIMKFLGLEHNFNLRLFNALIMYAGVYYLIKSLMSSAESLSYLQGLLSGLIYSISVGLLFSAFVGIYTYLTPDFMQSIKDNEPQGVYMNEFGITILIFIEAMASGILFTYATMQFMKKKKEATPNTTHQ
jgi:pheromone shutdown protein TraB